MVTQGSLELIPTNYINTGSWTGHGDHDGHAGHVGHTDHVHVGHPVPPLNSFIPSHDLRKEL